MKRFFNPFIKFSKSLRIRVPVTLAIVPAILAVLMISITIRLFNDRIVNENTERAEIMTRVLAESIDGDAIDRYLETLEKDDDYHRVMDLIFAMHRKSEITYLYVAQFTEEGAYYIFDADEDEETHWDLGFFYDWIEETSYLSRETLMMLANGQWPEGDITYSEWGWLLHVYEPIYRSDGSVAAFAVADISMDDIIRERRVITTALVLSIAAIMVVTVLINIFTIQKIILKPVNALVQNVTDYQSQMISSGALPEMTAQQQQQFSGNELEVLRNILFVMESHIDKGLNEHVQALALKSMTLDALLDSIPDLIFIKDLNYNYVQCNISFAEHYKHDKDYIIGTGDFGEDGLGIPEELAIEYRNNDIAVVNERKTLIYERSETLPCGKNVYYETIKTPLLVDDEVIGILGISRNMTKHKEMESMLENSYKRTKMLTDALTKITKSPDFTGANISATSALIGEVGCQALNTSRVGVWSVYLDTQILRNISYYDSQKQEHTVEGDYDISGCDEYIDLLKTERLIITNDVRVPNPMSSIVEKYYGDDLCAMLDAPIRVGGRVVGVICLEQDKTDMYSERREWTIEEQNFASSLADLLALTMESDEHRTFAQRTELMMNSLPGMVFQSRNNPPDFTMSFLSEGCLDLTGYTREEIMGENPVRFFDIVHPDDQEMIQRAFDETLNIGLPFKATYRIITKDGTIKWIWDTTNVTRFDDNGDPYMLEGFYMDITEQRRLEAAETASRSKSEFLSNMSHEMRTPLNAIIGMTAIGKRAEDIEGKTHALNKIGDASSHLLGMVNDILDMAKIEANKLDLLPIEFNFEHMIEKVLTVIHFRVDEKNQQLTINLDKKIPQYLIGDDQRFSQVLINILWNAVKFTNSNGKINMDISLTAQLDSVCELRVDISDNGIGISPEQQLKLFDTFEQADNDTSRLYGGTGLGLTIAKRIVEMMGGNIWVESELGKGARFVFTVVMELVTTGAHSPELLNKTGTDEFPDESEGIFAGKRLLVAEDVEINREILIALLEGSGLLIDCAENGKEAVDMVSVDPEKYDIILMDLQMPLMDGLEATRLIRVMPELKGRKLPIVALTANVFKDDKDACIEAGMDDHIGKPLDIDKVMEKLREYLLD